MSAGRIARHRNYGDLMQRHERNQKLKRVVKIFIYFLIIAFFLIVFVMISRWEKRVEDKNNKNHSSLMTTYIQGADSLVSDAARILKE